ncbi:MAG: ATP-binding protein [Sandaracinus sp.]
MSTYQTTVVDIVGGIQDRLEDYEYAHGETILRELVQNADDAGATSLTFVLFERGLVGARNSLLHGPALVALNDGPFEPKDLAALRSQKATSKAADDTAVGRFGIGQKSVFHLCEAFWFLGSSEAGGTIGGVIDPWFDSITQEDAAHRDWADFSAEDADAVEVALRSLLPSTKGWFVLWVPLRTQGHAQNDGAMLSPRMEPELRADLRAALRSEELLVLRPQLKHVRRIFALEALEPQFATEDVATTPINQIGAPDEVRLTPASTAHHAAIAADMTSATRTYRVFAQERSAREPELAQLQADHNGWPTTVYRNRHGQRETRREKAMQHGAVTIVRRRVEEREQGLLRLRWAVFLPVLDAAKIAVSVEGGWSWWITIHGYWFLDSGRRRIPWVAPPDELGATTERDEARRAWNQGVRDRVSLPLLLPALAASVAELEAADATPVVRRLAEVLLSYPAGSWCAGKMLVLRAFDSRWQLADDGATIRVLAIPRPGAGVAPQVSRAFATLSRDVVVVYRDALPLRREPPATWREDDIEAVLAILAEGALDEDVIRFITEWVAACGPSAAGAVNRFVWKAAAKESLPSERANAVRVWQDLVAWADGARIVGVEITNRRLGEAARHVPDSAGVILPRHLVTRPLPRRDPVPFVDVIRWLGAEVDFDDVCRQLTVSIGVAPLLAQEDLAQDTFLVLRRASDWVYVRRSPDDVRRLAEERTLLLPRGAPRIESVLKDFVRAIGEPGFDLYVVPPSKEPADIDQWAEAVPDALEAGPASLAAILVSKRPTLRGPEERLPLFKALGAPLDDVRRRALRYLLHGDNARVDSTLGLWVPSAALDNTTVRALLDKAGQGWRVVPPAMARKLGPDERHELGISELVDDAAAGLVADLSDESLLEVFRNAPREDRRRFLRAVAHVEALARRLPVHEPIGGGDPVPASCSTAFWVDSFPIHDALRDGVVAVSLDDDPKMRALQQALIRKWTPEVQRDLALDLARRASRDAAAAVLAAVAAGAASDPTQPVAWLPLTTGVLVAPSQLALESSVLRDALAVVRGTGLHLEDELAADVREHSGWLALRENLARNPGRPFSTICDHLRRTAGCPIGWRLARDPAQGRRLLEAAPAARTQLESAVEWRFALAAVVHLGPEPVASALCGQVDSGTWRSRLATLGSDAAWSAFPTFVEVAVDEDEDAFVREVLPELRVRCADGGWRAADAVAREGTGLDPEFRLDAEIEFLEALRFPEIATSGVQRVNEPDDDAPSDRGFGELEEFLQAWVDRGLSPQHAAAFVSLLAPDGDIWDALAERWKPPGSTTVELQASVLNVSAEDQRRGARALDAFWRTSTTVSFAHPGTTETRVSLAGTSIAVRVGAASSGSGLMVTRSAPLGGPRVVRLLRIAPPNASAFANALRQAVRDILEHQLQRAVYPERLDVLWDALHGDGARVQLAAATRMVERDLPKTLRELGVHRGGELGSILTRLRAIDLRTARLEVESPHRPSDELVALEDEVSDLRAKLVSLIRGPSATVVAERVRAKLALYGYGPPQVLWELLQNADDAIVQRHGPAGTEVVDDVGDSRAVRIVLSRRAEGSQLSVVHRGRGINARRPGPDHASDEADLYNMLVLNISEKEAEQGVTGKFGLGFKSVHLLTSCPTVTSGSLRFRIHGGVLPTAFEVAAGSEETAEVRANETRFDIPLDVVEPDAVLGDARESLPFFPLFAAGVRAVRVELDTKTDHSWTDRGCTGAGDTTVRFARSGPGREVIVLERSGDARRYRVVIPAPGMAPSGVPTVWVTAPVLTERWRLPYLLGGPFDLDVGRTQLAPSSEANLTSFGVLGEMLRDLAAAEASIDGLGVFGEKAPRPERLQRLWNLFLSNEVVDRMREGGFRAGLLGALHGEGRGASFLARRALPTGLPAPWDEVTAAARVRWYAPADVQAPTLTLLAALQTHIATLDLPDVGEVIAEGVHDCLQLLSEGRPRARLGVGELLERSSSPLENIDASRTELVGCVATLALTRSDDVDRREAWLRARRFLSRAGSWRPADGLLIPALPTELPSRAHRDDLEDEPRRAVFAPAEYLLREEFCAGQCFKAFWACRSRLAVGTAKELGDWARRLDASDRERCRGVVRYLVDGALRAELAEELRRNRPAWIPTKAELLCRPPHWLLEGLTEEQFVDAVNSLYPRTREELMGLVPALLSSELPRDPAEELPKVLRDWRRNGRRILQGHDEAIFGRELRLSFAEPDAESWLALFTRASLYRMGRVSADQNRWFMKLCWERGWFGLFAGPARDGAFSRVISELQHDAVSDVPYLNWLMAFVFTHWFASHLGGYLDLLEKLDLEDGDASALRASIDSRASAAHSGGGHDLPPVTVLRWGLPFALRELRRRGVLRSPSWDPLCFATNRALRRALENVGLAGTASEDSHMALESSSFLYQALEEHLGEHATFDGGYDLALLHYSPWAGDVRHPIEEPNDDDL